MSLRKENMAQKGFWIMDLIIVIFVMCIRVNNFIHIDVLSVYLCHDDNPELQRCNINKMK